MHGKYSPTEFRNLLFNADSNLTAASFLREISYGQFELSGEVFGWFEVDKSKEYYSKRDLNGHPVNQGEFVVDVVRAADKSVDFRKYDNDGPDGVPDSGDDDGYVDAVLIFYPGLNEATNIQTFQGILGNKEYSTMDFSFSGQLLKINAFILVAESRQYSNTIGINKLSIICHEFMHVLGLPDLYDYTGYSMGLGNWCLMAHGALLEGSKPPHISAWCKVQLGWVAPSIVSTNQSLSVKPVETNPEIYLIWEDRYQFSRYFLLENRQKTGFDENLPGSGLLIYHVDENQRFGKILYWLGEFNNNLQHKLVDVEEADGRIDLDRNRNAGDSGDPFPGITGNSSFNNFSSPNSRDYDGNPTGVEIANIRYSGNENITADIIVRQSIGYAIVYDPNGLTGYGWTPENPGETVWGGVLFKANKAGIFAAVDVGFTHDVSNYQIDIYSSLPDPLPGALMYSVAGGSASAGWHTIDLQSANLWINKDQEFFVAYKTDNWITVDIYSDYTGRSYYSDDGINFAKLSSQDGNFNLRARIRTEKPVMCDFNTDGDINQADVIALLRFLQNNPGDLRADFNRDGNANVVDVINMLIAQKNGKCPDME